jgi:hypothetical protein
MIGDGKSVMRVRHVIAHFLLLTFVLAVASCKRESVSNNNATANAPANTSGETSTTPPFSTKEPERYQATVVVSTTLGSQTGGAPSVSREIFRARDGERQRDEYELMPGLKLVRLQLPGGNFVLYPAKKLYAEETTGAEAKDASKSAPTGLTPESLMNSSLGGARYEKLGTEAIGGRNTTKYRATVTGKTGEAKNVTTETLFWVDEALGMVIKSETTSTGEGASASKYTMEVRDLKTDVDAALFEVPKDYKKTNYKDILGEGLLSLPSLLGGDKDEQATKKR